VACNIVMSSPKAREAPLSLIFVPFAKTLTSQGFQTTFFGEGHGADTVMCVGEVNVADLVALCLQHSRSAV
jgi:hypothetical protein